MKNKTYNVCLKLKLDSLPWNGMHFRPKHTCVSANPTRIISTYLKVFIVIFGHEQ